MSSDRVRLHWVDFVKAINILSVVWIHTYRGLGNSSIYEVSDTTYWTSRFLGSFIMPGFFFMSGMFISSAARHPFPAFFKDKAQGLVYPYFLWATLHVSIQALMGNHTNKSHEWSELAGIFVEPPGHFWFVYTMFLVMMVFYGLKSIGVGPKGFLVFSLAFYSTGFFEELSLGTWGPMYMARGSMLYFALGAVVDRKGPVLWLNERTTGQALAISGVLYAVTLWGVLQGGRDMIWADPLLALTGGTATICLAILMQRVNASGALGWLEYCGKNSMSIYVAHVIGLAGVRIVLDRGLGIESIPFHFVAGMVGGAGIPLLIAWAAKRIGFPYMFTLKKPNLPPLKSSV